MMAILMVERHVWYLKHRHSPCLHRLQGVPQYSPMDHSLTHPNEKLWNFNIFWNSVCGTDPKMCFYADKICDQQPFHISSAKFLERQNMKQNVHNWWKKTVPLKACSSLCTSVFPISIVLQLCFIFYFWYGFWGAHCGEDLKCGLG